MRLPNEEMVTIIQPGEVANCVDATYETGNVPTMHFPLKLASNR